jgi:hypothetical protein
MPDRAGGEQLMSLSADTTAFLRGAVELHLLSIAINLRSKESWNFL